MSWMIHHREESKKEIGINCTLMACTFSFVDWWLCKVLQTCFGHRNQINVVNRQKIREIGTILVLGLPGDVDRLIQALSDLT